MSASRQLHCDGSRSERAWEAPTATALPVRATATSWGFKWDSSWGGGSNETVGQRPPQHPIKIGLLHEPRLACDPDQRGWQVPAFKALSVRATAAGWGSKLDTYMALDRGGSIGHLAPNQVPQNARARTWVRPARKPDQRGWEAPVVQALSIRATATSWSFSWDSGWGGEKSKTIAPLPPEQPANYAPRQVPAMKVLGKLDPRAWEAPMIHALSVGATASSLGIKWDLYMAGGKMETAPQSPPQGQSIVGAQGARASHGSEQRSWEAPAVTALSLRLTAFATGD